MVITPAPAEWLALVMPTTPAPQPAAVVSDPNPRESATTAPAAAVSDPATPREAAYEKSAIKGELKRLTDLKDQGWDVGWDTTTFEVACNLWELINAPWAGLTEAEGYRLFIEACPPSEPGYDPEAKWGSAMAKVGDKARSAPERERDFMDDAATDPNVRKAPLARPEGSLRTSQSDTAQTSVSDPPASWKPQDLDSILSGTYCAPEATLFTRADGVSLMYAGLIHSFHGESESGKSLVMQIETAKLLRKGRDVLFMDFESDAASVVQRLIEFGAPRDAIRDHLYYVKPEVSPKASPAELAAWATLLQRRYALAVIDGVTDSLGIFECSTKDNDDISRWMRVLPKRIADQTGAAVALIDHVTKDSDGRGRFAIGGQAKMAGLTGAAYTVEVIEPLGRGLRGVVSLRIGKDRPGSIRPHCGTFRKGDRTQEAAHVVIDSTGSSPVVKVFAPVGRPGEAEKVKETRLADLMEKISREIEVHAGCSQAAIYKAVSGNEADKADAVRKLVEAGSVTVTRGPRNSHLHTSARPYRKDSTDRLRESGDGQ